MKNKNDDAAISSELKAREVDTEFVVNSQRELETISEEQAFLCEMKQQNVQHNLKEQNLFQELQKLMVALNALIKEPSQGLYDFTTFHKTKPYLDSKRILRHRKTDEEDPATGSNVYMYIDKQKVALCTRIDGLAYYVQTIKEDGTVQLVRNPVWNKMSTNTDGSISIKFEQEFLSANRGGKFRLSKNNLGFEHFWLHDHMLPTILKLEELMDNIDSSPSSTGMSRKSEILVSELNTALSKEKEARRIDSELILKFSKYFTARIDIKFVSKTGQGDFQILSVSDSKAKVQKPEWLQKNGIGYQIESYAGEIEIATQATADGQINFNLRGIDVQNPEDKTKRIPYWVDYKKFTVNDKLIFDTLTPAWHGKIYRHNVDVKAGEEVKIQVEWLPHRSDS